MAKINSVTPTICKIMHVTPPSTTEAQALPLIIGEVENLIQTRPVQKCLVYAPDALGSFLLERFSNDFNRVREKAPISVDLEAVMLSFTPVCFASMFSGALPETTGIKKYEKPVLTVETLFDVLAKDGKRVALVAVKDSSIDIIFRERKISYYSENYDDEATERAIELMKKNAVDFILLYNQEYDDLMHRFGPFDEKALKAMYKHIDTFERLANVFHSAWRKYDRALVFTPDHGAHYVDEKKCGTHGTDMPEDLDVRHYWGIFAKEE